MGNIDLAQFFAYSVKLWGKVVQSVSLSLNKLNFVSVVLYSVLCSEVLTT